MIVRSPYRAEVLANRAQREQLDHLLKVTAPNERLFIMAIGAIILAFLAWLVFGSVARTISADGVLAGTGARHAVVVSGSGGRLEAWLVEAGDRVEAGAPVARLALPELDARIAAFRDRVGALEKTASEGGDAGDLTLTLAAARLALVPLEADRIASSVVASPAAGEVSDLRLAPGDGVAAGDRIASIREAGRTGLRALARIPASMAREVGPGMPAMVTMTLPGEPQRSFAAEVDEISAPAGGDARIGPDGPSEPMWTVRLSVDTGGLRPPEGETVHVRIVLGRQSPAALLGLART